MSQGTIESSTGTNLEIGVEWTSVADAPSNSSTVTARVFLHHYQIYCVALSGSYVTVGDKTEYFSRAVSSSSGGLQKTYIAEKTFTVPHNSDGTKSVRIAAGYVFNGTYNGYYIGTLAVAGNADLDRIPRASDFTLPGALTLTQPAAVKISAASSSYTHRAVMRLGNAVSSGSVLSGATLSVTPPASLADASVNSKRPAGTFTLETYSGGTKLGEVTKNCTFVVPETAEFLPDFTLTATPTNTSALLDSENILAAGLSSLAVRISGASCRHGAAVSSTKITFGSRSTTSGTLSTGTLAAGTFSYTAKVTDSRGLSKTKSGSVTVLPYFTPYADSVDVHRCLADGTADDSGTYLSAYAKSKCASLGGRNTCTAKLVLRSRAGAKLGEWALTSGQTALIAASLSTQNSYTVSVEVTDTAGKTGTYRLTVPTSKVDVHLKDGKLRIGGYAERAGLEVDWDARFNGDLSIGDDTVADVIVAAGKTGIWTWRKYASGASECFGTAAVKTYPLTASYGAFVASSGASGEALNSESYPGGLFVAAPTVNATPARSSHPVLIAPRNTGSAAASPDYRIIYPAVPEGGSVDCALHISAKGKWK